MINGLNSHYSCGHLKSITNLEIELQFRREVEHLFLEDKGVYRGEMTLCIITVIIHAITGCTDSSHGSVHCTFGHD